jgi:hypothetical protein
MPRDSVGPMVAILGLLLLLLAITTMSSACDTQPPYVYYDMNDEQVRLVNSPEAADPTWDELKAFLTAEKTDESEYIRDEYMCGEFAKDVHDKAEAAGITSAWVLVRFQDDCQRHALNAFNTTDKGLVYVDCSHVDCGNKKLCSYLGYPDGWDRVAYVVVGEEYGQVSLDVVRGLSYEDYETQVELWHAYDSAVEAYHNAHVGYRLALLVHNDEHDAYRDLLAGCEGKPSAHDCMKLGHWRDELEEEEAELARELSQLDNELAALGGLQAELGEYWVPMGIVADVEVYW